MSIVRRDPPSTAGSIDEAMNLMALSLARRMGVLGLPEEQLFRARDAVLGTLENLLERIRLGEWPGEEVVRKTE